MAECIRVMAANIRHIHTGDTKLIQAALATLGFTCFVDGYFAGEVERAIKRFKRDYTPSHAVHASYDLSKNPNTGDFDKDMLLALDEALVENTLEYTEFDWSSSELGQLIHKQESSNDYNVYNKSLGNDKYEIVTTDKITTWTVQQVLDALKDTQKMHAAGGFQVKYDTLAGAVKSLSLDKKTTLFDKATQNRIFNEYLIDRKRPAIMDYLDGESEDQSAAILDLAREFASMPVEEGTKLHNGKTAQAPSGKKYEGVSYYAGDGANKSYVKLKDLKDALVNTKKKQTAGFSEK